jgi:hypothetical protein
MCSEAKPLIKLSISFFSGLLAALICLAPLQAQTGTDAAVQSGAPAAAQAPDDMTKKITALVDAGKYAEAQALTTGLLVAYPDDQRLIKAKALLDKLLAPSSTPSAAPEDAQKQWSASANVAQLSGEDQLNYSALIELARESQQSSDLDEQHRLLKQFMEQSNAFLKRHPEQMMLWQLRAAAAIGLVEPMDGFEAGQKLLAAGAMDSNDPALRQLLVKLKLAGWLDKDKVTGLQLNADDTRRQQAAAAEQERQNAERAQYTFPAAHSNAFHYEYGHITIDENGAVYVGSDQTIHMLRTDMREVKAYCVTWICGLYFTPKSGRKYFIVAITEDAASSKQLQKEGLRPASVLGNAVVSKWKFVVSADNKTLTPPTNMAGMPPHR